MRGLANACDAQDVVRRLARAAAAVKRGARLLDTKVPNWRRIMRKYESTFDLCSQEFCVLGTLEHHSALRKMRAKGLDVSDKAYHRASRRLRLEGKEEAYGFDVEDDGYGCDYNELEALWKAEWAK